jgi:hypothetical protein
MPEPDDFDPTRALDGWRPPAPAPLDMEIRSLPRLDRRERGESTVVFANAATERSAFDPAHLLDGWRAPTPAPVDLELKAPLHAGGAVPDRAKKAWLKARGYEMLDVEDIELREAPKPHLAPPLPPAPAADEDAGVPEAHEAPALDFQAASPPAQPNPQFDVEDIQLPDFSLPPAASEAPVLDFRAAPPPARPDPRLLGQWQPPAWTALARHVASASTEVLQTPAGPLVRNHAPQWLCAVWPPQRAETGPLARWPDLAALVAAETATAALQQLLAELPDEATLWSTDQETDWGLIAELVLHQDGDLRQAQAQTLRELVAAERDAHLAQIKEGYALQGRVTRRCA